MICKSCQNSTEGTYCSNCGQKTATRRLTFKHFLEHDLVHGVLHLDKGLPKTLKEILIKPHKVAWSYIDGNRKPYYNFFYIILIFSGLYLFILSFWDSVPALSEIKAGLMKSKGVFNNLKALIFSYVPIFAIVAFLVFRKLRLNIIEHSIVAVISLIGACFFNLMGLSVFTIIRHLKPDGDIPIVFEILNKILFIATSTFPIFTYFLFVKNSYSFWGAVWRTITFFAVSIGLAQGLIYLVQLIYDL